MILFLCSVLFSADGLCISKKRERGLLGRILGSVKAIGILSSGLKLLREYWKFMGLFVDLIIISQK